ncbi:4-hydroxythreonine-4-phosphate dehydrogenase PdxA [Actinoallomurus sp. NBC_01490]|uniref:4-hydroxythreonine-4-phosphate dehydrogenase PdxA n=1 Tax=Actinoallomurus sp. NBC_01490 TaxID=2903557 RepID=UPI002E37E9C4|nr:4-hydroxythreonine-4-phosphate dehydrogenase PdxA [Actinoallomurus sp. NBC_01490]
MSREGTSSIGIAALSPHAGESGMFGQREIDEIVPSVGAARAAGVDARGSFPADTIS